MWTDCQRDLFFDLIFSRSNKSQHFFIQKWFDEHIPLQHLDFTRVLPRFLSLYIFSFLEPKSLSRAAQVCWHWKFLTDQDIIWMPKCLMRGWFLPYTPPDNEYGAWKKHYLFCVDHLDYVVLSEKNDVYGLKGDKPDIQTKMIKSKSFNDSLIVSSRPPWKGPDMKPKDLEKAFYAFIYGHNPASSKMSKSLLSICSRWGMTSRKRSPYLTKSLDWNQTNSFIKSDRQKFLNSMESKPHSRLLLSEVQSPENLHEIRLRQLVDQPWEYNREMAYGISTKGKKHELFGKLDAKINSNTSRIILISSRIQATELLLNALKLNVHPIVYEFEGNTIDSLRLQVENFLDKNNVRSIGLFCHEEKPGEINLVEGCQINAQNFHSNPSIKQFFLSLSSCIVTAEQGGHFDIFTPLAASEDGMHLMADLSSATGMVFSSPNAIVDNYGKVLGIWLDLPGERRTCPAHDYFCENRLNAWVHTAKYVTEAIKHCKETLAPFLKQFHKDLVARITGEVIFDVIGRTFINNINKLVPLLVEGLCLLGRQKDVNYLEFLCSFFHKKFEAERQKRVNLGSHETAAAVAAAATVATDTYDEEVATINDDDLLNRMVKRTAEEEEKETNEKEVEDEGLQTPIPIFTDTCPTSLITHKEIKPVLCKSPRLKNKEKYPSFSNTFLTQRFEKLSAEDFAVQPDKRTCVCREILASEMDFVHLLAGLKRVFFKPLSSALASNRAIISLQNVEIIFTDILTIHKIHKELCENLTNRFADWNGITSCLGDIFMKFTGRLQAYVNLINNFDAILRCIDRVMESVPMFRAFLCRHMRRPEVKMMTLQEVLFSPLQRINGYVTLLSWFQVYTPHTHPDNDDLASVIDSFSQLDGFITETKLRLQREEELLSVRRKVLNCPVLTEGNRHFLKQQDALLVQPLCSTVAPELRVYQCTEIVGFFLFNDVLVVTRRTSRHRPFSLAIDYTYTFVCSIQLQSIRVKNIANSRYVNNAFKLVSPSNTFYCCTDSYTEKIQWLSLLQRSIRAVAVSEL